MTCVSKDLYKSVRKCQGARVAPGIRPFIFFALASVIKTWPTLPEELSNAATGMGELAKYSGNFALAADKGFHRLDLVDLKSDLNFETQGEAPSATFLNKAELIVGGTDAEIKAFASQAVNDNLVYLVPNREGKFVVIGAEAFETKTTVSGTTGKALTDQAQTTIAIECPNFVPLPFYPGEIVTDETDSTTNSLIKISGEDGSLITS